LEVGVVLCAVVVRKFEDALAIGAVCFLLLKTLLAVGVVKRQKIKREIAEGVFGNKFHSKHLRVELEGYFGILNADHSMIELK